VDREAQDAFALRSHQLADAAWNRGFYDPWVIPVEDFARDEGIRADTSLEKLAKLKPAFVKDGTVTAGNASPLNDGASALLLASEQAAQDPIARIAGRGTFAVDPDIFGIGPVEAANRALKRAGISWDQVDAVELNEAFAAQSLACVGEWPIDPERVNVNGGAIAIGHPLGASGGRILGTLAYTLRENGWKYGVAAICIGVGQGLAVVLEAV
jgi:acetyl-CoA acetyltransferase family protein